MFKTNQVDTKVNIKDNAEIILLPGGREENDDH